jgi:hypothetical protein
MRRREFITLLGGAASLPLAARAERGERMRRIGVLDTLAADDPEASVRHGAFMQGLQELGWSIGRNLRIDTRWAAGDTGRIRSLAAEMVGLGPDVIFASGFSTIGPLIEATRTVPIVFANVVDPVGAGFVASLARPGGNVTGFSLYEFGFPIKWLELLKQIAPGITRAAVLRDPSISALIGQFADGIPVHDERPDPVLRPAAGRAMSGRKGRGRFTLNFDEPGEALLQIRELLGAAAAVRSSERTDYLERLNAEIERLLEDAALFVSQRASQSD